jgi:Domain of unknown function (DUF4034)
MTRVLLAAFVWMSVTGTASAGWVRRYDPLPGSRFEGVVSLSDGGAVLLTGSESVVVRTNADGDVVASRKVDYQPWFVVRGPGDAIFVGTRINDSGKADLRVMKLDAKLAVTWSARFLPPEPAYLAPKAANATEDGGLLMAGSIEKAAYVVRLGADGRVAWAQRFDAANRDDIFDIIQTRDGGVVFAGLSREGSWLARLSGKGELEWQQVYPEALGGFDSVLETTGGDLIAAGSTGFIVRTTNKGAAKWARVFHQDDSVYGTLAPLTNDSFAMSVLIHAEHYLLAFRGDGSQLWQQKLTPVPASGFFRSLGGTELASTSKGLYYAPPLTPEGKDPGTFLFRVDADGTTGCSWFAPSNIPWIDATVRSESLPMEIVSLTFEKQAWDAKLADKQLTASPMTCVAAPVVAKPSAVPPVATSSFDEYASLRKNRTEWIASFRNKDFAALERTAAALRAKKWSEDPLHWDIDAFYQSFTAVEGMDQPEVLARLREWIAAQPQSITPKIALAEVLHDTASKRRGNGTVDTVPDSEWEAFEKLVDESTRTLMSAKGGEDDPHYWKLAVRLALRNGEDTLAVARRAAKHTQDPAIAADAVVALAPQWQDRVPEFRPFAEEMTALTRATMGDTFYYWLAYQAQYILGTEKADTLGFEWPRVVRGGRDLIRLAPAWIPSYHRLAFMARLKNDRALAREMFQRPELDWYGTAATMWHSRMYYDAAREWALRTPAEPFVEAPLNASSKWPQIVMQDDLVIAGAPQPPRSSFLVGTPEGLVGISALPNLTHERDNLSDYVRQRLTSWTMASSEQPKRLLKVERIDTRSAINIQRGAVLVLAPVNGTPPVHVLKMHPPDSELRPGRVFVVACQWTSGACVQTVVEGMNDGAGTSDDRKWIGYNIRLKHPLDPATSAGAAVLDEDGYAIAVVTDRAAAPSGSVQAESLQMILAR